MVMISAVLNSRMGKTPYGKWGRQNSIFIKVPSKARMTIRTVHFGD